MQNNNVQILLSPEEAEHRVLAASGEGDRLMLPLGLSREKAIQDAFERGIDKNWYVLVDILPTVDGNLMRLYKLTDAGITRKGVLQIMFMTKN